MSDDQTKQLLGEISLGIEAESFLESEVGKRLIARAESERDDAVNELKTADPENAKQIRDLQNRIWLAESFQKWIAEIISSGWNAETVMKMMDSTD